MKKILLFLLTLTVMYSCKKDSLPQTDNYTYQELKQELERRGNFTQFLKAMDRMKMHELINDQPFTVLAPNDKAFVEYYLSKGITSLDHLNKKEVEEIARLCYLKGKMEMGKGNYYPTFLKMDRNMDNIHLYISMKKEEDKMGTVMETPIKSKLHSTPQFDVFETEGITSSPSVYDLIMMNPNLMFYTMTLSRTDLEQDFASILKGSGSVTALVWNQDYFHTVYGVSSLSDYNNLPALFGGTFSIDLGLTLGNQSAFTVGRQSVNQRFTDLPGLELELLYNQPGLDGYFFRIVTNISDQTINYGTKKFNIRGKNGIMHIIYSKLEMDYLPPN